MIVGLDTTVVVRLLLGAPAEQARRAEVALRAALLRGDCVLVADLTIAETYFALQHHYGVPKAEARAQLLELVSEPGFCTEPGSTARVALAADGGPGLVDRLLHGRHRACAAVTWTFDERLARLVAAEQP